MDYVSPPPFLGVFVAAFGLFQIAWYVIVLVLLVQIWRRVRHLPS